MKRILLVDDLRNFRVPISVPNALTIARTSTQALEALSHGEGWDEIWLDHDLGEVNGQLDDVMRVVDYLSERAFNDEPVVVDVVYVHTSNHPGGSNIVRALERFGYPAKRIAPEPYFIVGDQPEGPAA